jgi:hypothetical protein
MDHRLVLIGDGGGLDRQGEVEVKVVDRLEIGRCIAYSSR